MKLIINEKITLPTEQINLNMLNEFNIMTTEIGENTIVLPQKICLNEMSMNLLFSECLFFGQEISIRYADVGGPGCEMSLSLHQNLKLKSGGA